ncbi:MAG: DUF4367 domain-containing protein [Lachnospiraceae bacterium]|jgi:hypothetical protein|nr:DUF4367 domain-containing protein [Lachnospiraceae bacterium]
MKSDFTAEQYILRQASKQLFCSDIQRLKQRNSTDEVFLNPEQIKLLAEKIRLLPEDWQEALLLCYGCGFDADLSGKFLHNPEVSDNVLYAKDVLAYGMNLPSISRESLAESCSIILDDWHKQVKSDQQDTPLSTSRELDKKIRRMIRERGKAGRLLFSFYAKRVAMIFLALLIASTVTVLSVEALRNKFFDWLFTILPTHTRVEMIDVVSYSDTDNAFQPNQYAPMYLPEGFVLVDTLETDTRYKVFYANADKKYIIFEVRLINDQDHINVNTENNDMEELNINGRTGYYVDDDLGHMILWSDDLYVFSVICETSKNDAIKVAESTKFL